MELKEYDDNWRSELLLCKLATFLSARRKHRLAFALLLIFVAGICPAQPPLNPLDTPAAKQLESKLNGSCSIVRENAPLRDGLLAIESNFGIRIWLDRRIDPDQKTSFSANGESLLSVLRKMADTNQAAMGRVEGLVYVGPKEQVPLIEAAYWRLFQTYYKTAASLPKQTKPLQWEMLSSPIQLLSNLESRNGWQLQGLNLVSHDLWNQGSLDECSDIAQLTCLLAGFGLQAMPQTRAGQFQIQTLNRTSDVSQIYTEAALKRINVAVWQSKWPTAKLDSRTRTVTAPVQAQCELFYDPSNQVGRAGQTTAVQSLDAARYSLQSEAEAGRILASIQEKTKEYGFEFAPWPLPEKLSKQVIRLDVKGVAIDELLSIIGKELGIQFRRSGKKFEWTMP